jgi:valyl-tRNA synthetase
MTQSIDKNLDPAAIEAKWYAHWEQSGVFAPGNPNGAPQSNGAPYTIVIPPPNVTGSLHMGHALNNTLQDVLIRYHRMRGFDTLWQPGTDHAGIATQMVVERQLDAQGLKRTDMSREDFVKRVWAWKEESGGTITSQLRRLGASCDWSNERFTMDPGFSAAVTKVFVELYNRKLLYRDKRLVNWDPKLKTSISDLEVEQREVKGKFWHFRYPLEDGSGFIAIATTRPETILGDGAVAVHPDDERYQHLIGKKCKLPIVDRLIPIIADTYVKMDFGSGAVKITAAHDFNDHDVYKRHPDVGIPLINLMNPDATMNENCPPQYRGLDRYDARKKVVEEFEALGLLDKVEDHTHMVPFGDRSGVVVEPYLTDQWYVDAKKLAEAAIKAVDSGRIKFVPANWKKTWDEWMNNIQPWCVSRQLWWGHQIPAWYDEAGNVFVADTEDEALALARHSGESRNPVTDGDPGFRRDDVIILRRDSDVLDTWFSSALWPFGTLGWPDNGEKLKNHYPGSVLVTGFDIIFFWVARMVMQGLEFMDGAVPFHTVYIHGLVRDEKGQKMAKSKGNVKDPLDFINKYGADALRFFMCSKESQGRDIKLNEQAVAGFQKFGTKLWNAARFCQMNGIEGYPHKNPPEAILTVNRWIIGEVAATVQKLDAAIAGYRFDDAANTIYSFVWNTFCDWYLELTKPILQNEATPETEKAETRKVAGWVLDQILVLLHPFMPFITEELWHALDNERKGDLIVAHWPDARDWKIDAGAQAEIDWLVRLITEIRSARNELNVPPSALVPLLAIGADSAMLERQDAALKRVGRLSDISRADAAPASGAIQVVVDGATYALPVADIIDLSAEKARLQKALEKSEKEAGSLSGRLNNADFIAKAKPEVIEQNREQLAELQAQAAKLKQALARLG